MKTIIAFEEWKDNKGTGYFSSCGMNERYVSHLKTIKRIINEARNSHKAIPGRRVQIQNFDTGRVIKEFTI